MLARMEKQSLGRFIETRVDLLLYITVSKRIQIVHYLALYKISLSTQGIKPQCCKEKNQDIYQRP